MNKAAAALLCMSMLRGTVHPLTPAQSVTLRVSVKGIEPAECETVIRITDLSDGSQREQKLEGNTGTFTIAKGREYLAALKNCPPGWMPSEEILITSAQSANDLAAVFEVHPFEVRIVQYEEDTETFAQGGILQLRDESDEELIAFEPDEEGKIMDEEGEEFLFTAGTSYVLSQKESAPGFERGCEQLLLIPEFMEQSEEPLIFEYHLSAQAAEETPADAQPLPFYEFIRPAQARYGETDPFLEESEEEEPEKEEESHTVTNMAVSTVPSVVIPEVYLSRPQKESTKIENRIERTGFIVRLCNEEGAYISGALLEVKDENGKTVDQWQSKAEDHIVEGDLIHCDETYTVHLAKPAQGFSGSIVDIAHTVRQKSGSELPLIELCDTPVHQKTQTEKTETVKKTVNYALYACIAAALVISGLVAAVCLTSGKRH